MDSLSYRKLDFDKPWTWIVLQFNGKSLKELIGTPDEHFPASWVQKDLPTNPDEPEKGTHLIGVCGCGEWGCSFTSCRITRTAEAVELTEFYGYQVDTTKKYCFRVGLKNFDEVIGELVELSEADSALYAEMYRNK